MTMRRDSRAERQMARSLAVLGLHPGATRQDVEAAYFTRRAALEHEDDAERALERLEKAMRFIKVRERFADRERSAETKPTEEPDRLGQALRLLGLAPGATHAQVDAALEHARRTVSDRERLREFHKAAGVVKNRGRQRRSRRRSSVRGVSWFLVVASVTLVALAVISGFQLASRLRPHFVHFEVGDTLYRYDDGARFGVVLAFEEGHRFPNDTQRDAYQIHLHDGEKNAWISAETARSALKAHR